MKKSIVSIFALALLLSACGTRAKTTSDAMKIPYDVNIDPEYGADSVERDGDHQSAYYATVDYYNTTSDDQLTLLEHYKTYQQTSEWSCGPAALLTVLEHYGKRGDWNELTLAQQRPQKDEPSATSLSEMIDMVQAVGGFTIESAQDYASVDELTESFTLEKIQNTLQEGDPILVGWNDWGGHWQAIIGYDTMNTETVQDDVLIVADPYDTTDHNQDGYGTYPAERFIYNFTFYNFFPEEDGQNNNVMQYLIIRPQ